MKYLIAVCSVSLISLGLISCDLGPESPRGFSFPKGDSNQGTLVIAKYQCLSCHQIKDLDKGNVIDNPELNIPLGGKSTKVKTYAELVTSVINPSHKIVKSYPKDSYSTDGKSKMKNFNEEMTINELINLVTYLETKYELIPYSHTNYQLYNY